MCGTGDVNVEDTGSVEQYNLRYGRQGRYIHNDFPHGSTLPHLVDRRLILLSMRMAVSHYITFPPFSVLLYYNKEVSHMNPFSINLIDLRTTRELKHDDVANALKLSRVTIAYYETGRRLPTMQKVTALADFFGVPVSDLLLTDEEITLIEEDGAIDRLCAAIKRYCDAQNITPQRLSRSSGLPFSIILSVLTPKVQKRPTLDQVLMLALSVRRSVTELLTEKDVPLALPKKPRARSVHPYSAESMARKIDSLPIDSRMALSKYLDFLVDQAKGRK